jgi:hypothetical protein
VLHFPVASVYTRPEVPAVCSFALRLMDEVSRQYKTTGNIFSVTQPFCIHSYAFFCLSIPSLLNDFYVAFLLPTFIYCIFCDCC